MSETPSILIASSSEQIATANRIAAALEEPSRWSVKVRPESFAFSLSYIESLEKELD